MSEQRSDRDLALSALTHASRSGCEACEVVVRHPLTWTATWQTAAVVGAVTHGPNRMRHGHVRVFGKNGRSGVAEGTVGDTNSIQALVKAAAKAAGRAKAPTGAPSPRLDTASDGLGIADRRQPQITDEARANVVNDNVRMIGGVKDVEPDLVRYTETLGTRTMVSSTGIDLSETSTHYTLFVRVKSADGAHAAEDEVRSRHYADVASLPVGLDLARQVARYTNATDLPGGEVPVVLEPRVIARIMAVSAAAFDQNRIDAGQSFVTNAREQRVGSPLLHMLDDATLPGAPATRAFDDRGISPLVLPLIREGMAGAFYLDVDGAVANDGRPSGHESTTGCWSGNLLLRSGNRSRNMIFPELGDFVLFDALVGEDWYDLKTGRLTLRGHMFKAHGVQPAEYVGIHTLETTFIDLWSGIREIGNDQRRFGNVDVSTWLVDGLTVSD